MKMLRWQKFKVLLTALQAGEDFAGLAQQVSEDPGSSDNGGSLGMMAMIL